MPHTASRRRGGVGGAVAALNAWWRRRSSAQRRRLLVVAAVLVAFVVVVSSCVANATERARLGDPVDLDRLPASVGEWQGEQIEIAAIIVRTAQALGVPTRGQEIAVMVGMGESSLRNLDVGDDARNPDGSMNCSLGVFQQQWCLGWGTRDEVLDPAYAARAFLDRMVEVDGWEALPPGEVGHRVQVNQDPHHYTPYFDDAQDVVEALTGARSPA